jgi:3',5'-cyclic AMP phosphodiesterase CpdA
MRLAHFSDLHLLSLEGVPLRRFLNKRATGWANLRLRRGSVHRASYVTAIAREIRKVGVDHVIITGDLTNLALESEFELARRVIENDLSFDAKHVTIVPGNHDVYTRGSHVEKRFAAYFADYLVSDLPELTVDVGAGRFPIVKLRGPVAVIGLCSAVPRLPFIAAGRLGKAQLSALQRVLEHAEVRRRTPIVAIHHPPHNPSSKLKTMVEGLSDAAMLWTSVRHVPACVIVHGHLHRRVRRTDGPNRHGEHLADGHHEGAAHPKGGRGAVTFGATSASLHHHAKERMAGFNVYEVSSDGALASVSAHVLEEDGSFDVRAL